MADDLSQRRMIENEVVFRELNEKVQKGFDLLNIITAEEGEAPILLDRDTPLHFYCECSDENCRNRIKISPKMYNKYHKKRNTFTIQCGHEVPSIEEITYKNSDYYVVKKFRMPPSHKSTLQKTQVKNV